MLAGCGHGRDVFAGARAVTSETRCAEPQQFGADEGRPEPVRCSVNRVAFRHGESLSVRDGEGRSESAVDRRHDDILGEGIPAGAVTDNEGDGECSALVRIADDEAIVVDE